MTATRDGTRIQDLGRLLSEQAKAGLLPVEKWNPPYCGDIGMAIKSDGTWFYQSSPIGRLPLVKLFARVLRRDEDGRHLSPDLRHGHGLGERDYPLHE